MLPEPLLSWLSALLLLLHDNDEKALFLVLLVEESGVPLPFVPGDVLIMFAGYRASTGQMGLLEAGIAATLAVQMGSTILYALSRKFGHTLLYRYGRFIHLDETKLGKIEKWIQRRGPVMVLIGRLTPGLRTPTSIISGVFHVPFHQFFLFTTLSALIWSVFWLVLGYYSGRTLLPLVEQYHSGFSIAAVLTLAVGLPLGLVLWRRLRGKRPEHAKSLGSAAAQGLAGVGAGGSAGAVASDQG